MLVDTQPRLQEIVRDIESEPVVAFDAEMDSYFSYSTKLCLIQISVPDQDILVDPLQGLDLTPLLRVTANPEIVKVFHAGDNDIPFFRQHGLEFLNIFDTHLAARVLGMSRHGLAALLEEFFEVTLDKRFQRADWRLRPLPEDQAEYARLDTRYLIPLREILLERLEQEGRLEEAVSEFGRVPFAELREKEFDPDGWVRMKGAETLSAVGRSLLKELYLWRDEQGKQEDKALFRIAPDPFLVSLARRDPRNRTELREWGRHPAARRYANELLEALERGRARGPIPRPRLRPRHGADPMDRNQQACYQRLRTWRNEECETRGVDPDRIATNRMLRDIARAQPRDLEELVRAGRLEPWRVAQYGEKLLEVASDQSR